jgi:hypothetical protein
MGFSQSWLAVKGKTPAIVLETLNLHGTGTREDFAESPITGAELPGGWYLVVANQSGHKLISEPVIKQLSADCEIIIGDVEEHVMVSMAIGWKNGNKVWSIIHDAQSSMEHLDTQGDLPLIFNSIRDKLYAEQKAAGGDKSDTDYIFDVPVTLAKALTGYRHDEDVVGVSAHPFEVLLENKKPGFLNKLFGSK